MYVSLMEQAGWQAASNQLSAKNLQTTLCANLDVRQLANAQSQGSLHLGAEKRNYEEKLWGGAGGRVDWGSTVATLADFTEELLMIHFKRAGSPIPKKPERVSISLPMNMKMAPASRQGQISPRRNRSRACGAVEESCE